MTGIEVLVLEDNPDDVVLIAEALEQNGFPQQMICNASTLARAKEYLAQRDFDVILADLNVPDSLGLGTVDALRLAAESTPLVVLTGTLE
ncbi:MAG: response regulator, partial [Actinomycetes bacterium]